MVTSTSHFVFLFIFISILYPGMLLRQVAGDELEGNHREVAGDDSVEDQNYGEVAGDDSEKESHGDTLARMPCVVHLRHCRPFAYEEEGKPPEDCCNAMKKMVTDKQQCLCGIFEHLGMLRVLNITKDDLQAIPKRCGFNGLDESECMKCTAHPNLSEMEAKSLRFSHLSSLSPYHAYSSDARGDFTLHPGGCNFWLKFHRD